MSIEKRETEDHAHEALHATYMASDFIERHVISAKTVTENPELKEIADRAGEALGELYQALGGKLAA